MPEIIGKRRCLGNNPLLQGGARIRRDRKTQLLGSALPLVFVFAVKEEDLHLLDLHHHV
jgi:hypothetical protein